jgi:HK97 family phage portal protein
MLKRIRTLFGKAETRAVDPSWGALSGLSGTNTATGSIVMTPRHQEQLAVACSCIEIISSGVAALPCYVYSSNATGRTLEESHPLTRLVRRGPNAWQSWFEFMHSLMRSALIFGNALVEPQYDNAGRLVGMKLIPWWCVSVQLLPSGRVAYDITDIVTAYGGTGRQRRLFGDEVLHVKDATDDGLVGKSRLARAGYVFASALGVQEMAAALYRNSANPSGTVQTEMKLNPEQMARLGESFRDIYSGAANAGKVVILDQGLKWSQMSINPEDAELLDSRRFAGEEMARLFQVPPPLVGIWDHSSFTNSETAGRWFAQHTLRAWIGRLESEFSRKLFSETTSLTHEIEFDLSALLRGDPETRWKSHEIAVRNNILSPDEVRAEEGWNPRPEGQQTQNQPGEAQP